MWLTWLLESLLHAPIECGCACAYAFTGPATRRSLLPSRSTGFTAEPSTLAYFAFVAFSSSLCGSSWWAGTSKPAACSSAIASRSCGIEAEMFGSFTSVASGCFAISPSFASASSCFCPSFRRSGKCARMRPASEMSSSSKCVPACLVKARSTGSRAAVASAGASSVSV